MTGDPNDGALASLLAKQRASFMREGPPPFDRRKADLAKLKKALLARRKELAAAVDADFGHRSRYETMILDLVPTVHAINYLLRNLARLMRPRRRRVALHFQPAKARVIYQPLGIVGIMSPWNYPLALCLIPLATAIAAGNRAMIKPSEFTPATNAAIASLLHELFPQEQVALVTGGAETGAAFSALPFDHLIFTGSTRVGRAVMRAASENLVPVTLELGGKSPVIVERGYPLARAAASIAYGKLANAGQTCIAPDYALVQEADMEAFLAAYERAVHKLYPGGSSDAAYASIINAQQYARLRGLIEDARKKGARVVEIDSPANPSPRERALVPTVLLGTTREMEVMQSEIFGPILPLVSYRDLDEAIAFVNARPRPLALYVFAREERVRQSVLERTVSGNVTVNDTLLHYAQDDLPFGGIGASGMGAYHGEEGFKALSHAKGIFEQAGWSSAGLVRSPFGWLTDLVLAYLLR
jgi:coniferyl-aldehyde dehydrogenase